MNEILRRTEIINKHRIQIQELHTKNYLSLPTVVCFFNYLSEHLLSTLGEQMSFTNRQLTVSPACTA